MNSPAPLSAAMVASMRYVWLLAFCGSFAAWQYYGHHLPPGLRPDRNGRISTHNEPATSKPRIEHEVAFKTRQPPGGIVRMGTWNLRRLGHGHKRLDLAARLIDDSFDVIALQEVMSEQGVKDLLAALPGWNAEISPMAVGRDSYTEFYAVLYRADYVVVERSFMVADTADALVREPFVTCMRAQSFDFCVASVHIIFGKNTRQRDREIDALGRMLVTLRARGREKDWILVGDFNRMPGAPGWDALHQAGWQFATTKRTATSLGKRAYGNPYDHILIDRRHTDELEAPSQRVDMVEQSCAGDFELCREQLSDHAPVLARFRVAGHADDD